METAFDSLAIKAINSMFTNLHWEEAEEH